MIIDCHHHIIQHWIDACGHPSRNLHMKYVQKMLTRTVASAYRARDGAKVDTSALFREGKNGWSGLTDVGLSIGRFGRIDFTTDGEDYYIQYMPVGMQDYVAPPELMLAQMTYAGVDHCILQAGGAYGAMTEYNAFAQNLYPDKVTGQMWVDEAMGGSPEALAAIDRAYHHLGLRAIYFGGEAFARHEYPWTIDAPQMDAFWAKLDELGIVFCVELSSAPTYDKAGYVDSLLRLGRILKRHSNIRCHLTMGVPVPHFARDGKWDFEDDVIAVYRSDQMRIEIMYPITWGGVWEYPYHEAHPLIRDLRDKVGAERLMWGSDMPNVERYCTYRQSLDYVRKYCTFLNAREMDLVLGGTAAELYGIGRERA